MPKSKIVSRAAMLLAALAMVTTAHAQVVIAEPAGDAGGVTVTPAGDAGGVGVYPAGDDYVEPGIGDGGADDLGAVDYGDPPELGDINIRVPLTLENLHADVMSWRLDCWVRSGTGRVSNIGAGWIEGDVDRGTFSGVVFVPVNLWGDAAPQDVRKYRCIVGLRTDGASGAMLKRDATEPEFRAVEGSTTISHEFRGTARPVVGVKGDWRVE